MQLGEQSGYLPEWRVGGAREEQETYTHRRDHSTMNINNIILSFFIPIHWYSLDVTSMMRTITIPDCIWSTFVINFSM